MSFLIYVSYSVTEEAQNTTNNDDRNPNAKGPGKKVCEGQRQTADGETTSQVKGEGNEIAAKQKQGPCRGDSGRTGSKHPLTLLQLNGWCGLREHDSGFRCSVVRGRDRGRGCRLALHRDPLLLLATLGLDIFLLGIFVLGSDALLSVCINTSRRLRL